MEAQPSSTSYLDVPFPSSIPTAPLVTISFSSLLSNVPTEHARLYNAAKSLGFFYLDLRGNSAGEALLADVDEMFNLMQQFFDLSASAKALYDFADQGVYYGYKGVGAEVIDAKGTKDRNEIYNISKDDILGISEGLPAPAAITQNRENVKRHIEENNTVLKTIFNSLSSSIGLTNPPSFTSLHDLNSPSGCHVRFIRAPPQSPSDRSIALGEHTDFGSLTILFNRIGGLQVLLPGTQDWVYVRPMPGHAIVNLGDAMVKFSAGVLRSNMHRVISPPGAQAHLTRYSLVYFCRPGHEIRMQALEGENIPKEASDEDRGAETTEEWLKRRHLGRKMQYFKGEEGWKDSMGTEEARL